ncbi:hypothetical protein C1646_820666 [Rhizophagus diaphanus]|nr:hypothetical protein C1646_820666 [Rhizophagus diaphanus] [Rhizophagus sp. MUCL 43196]
MGTSWFGIISSLNLQRFKFSSMDLHLHLLYKAIRDYFDETPVEEWSYLHFLKFFEPVIMSSVETTKDADKGTWRKRFVTRLEKIVNDGAYSEQQRNTAFRLKGKNLSCVDNFWNKIEGKKRNLREELEVENKMPENVVNVGKRRKLPNRENSEYDKSNDSAVSDTEESDIEESDMEVIDEQKFLLQYGYKQAYSILEDCSSLETNFSDDVIREKIKNSLDTSQFTWLEEDECPRAKISTIVRKSCIIRRFDSSYYEAYDIALQHQSIRYPRQSAVEMSSLSVPTAAAAPISYGRSPIPGQMPPAMPPDMALDQMITEDIVIQEFNEYGDSERDEFKGKIYRELS